MNTNAIDDFFGSYDINILKTVDEVLQEHGTVIASNRTQSRQHVYLCTSIHSSRGTTNNAFRGNTQLYEQFAEYQTSYGTFLIELHKATTKQQIRFVLEGIDPETLSVTCVPEAQDLYTMIQNDYEHRKSTGRSNILEHGSPIQKDAIHELYSHETIFISHLVSQQAIDCLRPGRPNRNAPWAATVMNEINRMSQASESPIQLAELLQEKWLSALQKDWQERHEYIRAQATTDSTVICLGGAHFASLHAKNLIIPLPYIEKFCKDINYDVIQLHGENALMKSMLASNATGFNPLQYSIEELAKRIQAL